MNSTAQGDKTQILITDVGSYFGSEIAQSFLDKGYIVFGSGHKHPTESVLTHRNFTLLDIDLAQPFPDQLSNFDIIIHLSSENLDAGQASKLSAVSQNIVSQAKAGKSKVIFAARVTANPDLLEFEKGERNLLKLFLVGDIYGPKMNLHSKYLVKSTASYFESNELINLISQAVESDKIILDHDGTTMVYPTYIGDAKEAFLKFAFDKSQHNIKFIVSSRPQTALFCAYEIQNAMKAFSGKGLSLFFAGEESFIKPKPEPMVAPSDLHLPTKHTLDQGLKKTLEYFKKDEKIIPAAGHTPNTPSQEAAKKDRIFIPPHPKAEIEITKKSFFPSFPARLNSKLKRVVLVFAVLLLFFTSKTALDIYFGINYLKSAKKSLDGADFISSGKNAQNAQKSFQSASAEFKILSFPAKFVMPAKTKAILNGLESAQNGSSALANFVDAAGVIAQNLKYITQNKSSQTSLDINSTQLSLGKAYFKSAYASQLAKEAQSGGIFTSKLKDVENSFKTLAQISLNAQELTNLLINITGTDSPKSYLLLLENNAELRPGGGFIGNYAIITFDDGKLKDVTVDDIYNIDGQLKEKVSPPLVLVQNLGVDNFYLRDSNWTTDFDINAQTARDFYKKETGQTIDGVIAIDMTFVQNLLEKTGSVKLDDYNEEITSSNLFEKGEYYAEVGFFPGSTQKKDFFASLTKKLISQITDSLSQKTASANSPWLAFIQTASDSLSEKHMLLSFDDTNLQTYIKSKGWDNELPPSTYNPTDDTTQSRDFLALSEANVGANKVNHYISRKVSYDMTVDRDAGLMATTTITYQNNSPADTWPAGAYVNYLRLYVPQKASLESYIVDGEDIDLAQQPQIQKNKKQVETAPLVSQEGNLTVIANLVEVPVHAAKTFVFKYRIPKNIKLETAPSYSFYISKQPGTLNDPFTFAFNLPAYLKIDSINGSQDATGKQNYTAQTDLKTDRAWEIKVAKK